MPIYEFVCAACNYEFESLQRLSDPPPANCPSCGSSSISKKLSAAGFRLKGGGWYETDFKNKKAVTASQGDGSAPASAGKTEAGAAAERSGEGPAGKDKAGKASAGKDRADKDAGAGSSSSPSSASASSGSDE